MLSKNIVVQSSTYALYLHYVVDTDTYGFLLVTLKEFGLDTNPHTVDNSCRI